MKKPIDAADGKWVEVEDAQEIIRLWREENQALARELGEERAEVERLTAALHGIADMPEYDQDDAHRLRAKARAATAKERPVAKERP